MLTGHKRMSVADERMFTKKQVFPHNISVIQSGTPDSIFMGENVH